MVGTPSVVGRILGTALWIVPLLVGVPSGDSRAQAPEGGIEELVVTSQKREERLQDVPLSVAVIGSDVLETFRRNEVTDLPSLVPGLSLTNAAGPRSFGFFVRGIGTTSFSSESIEGSTAFVLDGVVLGQSGAAFMDLPDVERVEVLRGPQGTLFGKNASAGVISVTTRRPTADWQVRGSLSAAAPGAERKLSASISGPLSENARFLVSGRSNQRNGYVSNRFDGRDLNDRADYGTRARLELQPLDALSVTLIGDVWRRDAACCISTLRRVGTPRMIMPVPGLPPVPMPDPEREQLMAGIVPGSDNQRQLAGGDVFVRSQSQGASAQLDYEFGGGYRLTSISALRRWHTLDGLDIDGSGADLLDVNFADFDQHQFTQELRISSPGAGRIDYVAGLFYFGSGVKSESTQLFPQVALPFASRVADNRASTRNAAVFGQANLHLTDALTVIAGSRVLREEARASKRRLDPVMNLRDGASEAKSDEALVWRGGLQYQFTPDLMAFATATRGYKGGGFDTNVGLATLPDVDPEEPTSYELGLRSSWADQRLIANLTAFWTDVDGYQTTARDAENELFFIRSAAAETRGVEFDLFARPIAGKDVTVALSGAYVDARWGRFRNAPCYDGQTEALGCVGTVQDLTGEPLPFSPKWAFDATLGSAWQVGTGYGLRATLHASYRGKSSIQFPSSPSTEQSAYALADLALAFGPNSGRWTLSLYGKNLTDRRYASLLFPTPFGGEGGLSQFVPYEAQRVTGVSLDFAF